MAYAGQRRSRFERAPWRRPRGTPEVVEYLFRHHFDEVVAKLGRHPYTRGTSASYREELASEVLKRMLESGQLQRYEPGAVGAWITQAVYRHRNEADRAYTRLSVTEGELDGAPTDTGLGRASLGLDAFEGPPALQPELAVDAKQRDLAALELRAQLSEELQQLYQLRWEQGLPPRVIRSHFGWSLKQYEKRDAKLKSLVLAAVQRSAPDSIVTGHGDGAVCRETQELLPLALRQEASLPHPERLRLDAHLLTCDSCRVAAREARRVLDTVRPLFVPVGPALGGGAALGGGLMANLWAKGLAVLGVGGAGGGAAAGKVAGVAGCVAACVVGGEAILRAPDGDRPPKRTVDARTDASAERPTGPPKRRATMSSARQTPAPPAAPRVATRKTHTTTTVKRAPARKRARPSAPARTTPQASPAATSSAPAGEFVPEVPPSTPTAAPSPPPAATSASATAAPPTGAASGAEFAGP